MASRSTKKTSKKKAVKKVAKKPAKELTTRDLTPSQAVDWLVTLACNIIPQGTNPQAMVKEYEFVGAKIKKALKK